MKIPKRVVCECGGESICEVDAAGFGHCGDGISHDDGGICLWVKEVLEWQEIEVKESQDGDTV